MPELPEVETIRRQLETLIGASIIAVRTTPSKVVRGDLQRAVGTSIRKVRRFGKLLVIDLENAIDPRSPRSRCSLGVEDDSGGELSLCMHLKMTGRVTLLSPDESDHPHTHIQLLLADGRRLTFADARRFGYVSIHTGEEMASLQFIKTLGKEPLKDLRLAEFSRILAHTRRAIKIVLLDQTKIAGIGNIYACEALWMCRIHPALKANTLSTSECKQLFAAIGAVLEEGIRRGGASDNTYRNLFGGKGNYQDFFKVYGRAGEPCQRCGERIVRETLGGRGTFYCPVCQKG